MKCHRDICKEEATKTVRNASGNLFLSFCNECYRALTRAQVIDGFTGKLLTT